MHLRQRPPQLFLAVVPHFYPWKEVSEINEEMQKRQVGVLFSYYHFTKSRKMKERLLERGLHDFFEHDGPIWMDSGAYSAWNSGRHVSLKEYVQFITKLAPSMERHDAVIVLDAIGDERKTQDHWNEMQRVLDGVVPLVPVVHYPHVEVPGAWNDVQWLALGGMVRSFQINRRGSPYMVARWLGTLLQHNSNLHGKHLHGLGLGSPLLQVALQPPLSSLDWLGWRRNAAICEVYTPEGSKIVMEALLSRKVLSKRPLTDDVFERYAPPFLSKKKELALPGKVGFINRALWNAWWFLKARDHEHLLMRSRYVQAIRKNLKEGS